MRAIRRDVQDGGREDGRDGYEQVVGNVRIADNHVAEGLDAVGDAQRDAVAVLIDQRHIDVVVIAAVGEGRGAEIADEVGGLAALGGVAGDLVEAALDTSAAGGEIAPNVVSAGGGGVGGVRTEAAGI